VATESFQYNDNTTLLTEAEAWSEDLSAASDQRTLAMQRGVYLPSTLAGPRVVHITGRIMEDDADAARAVWESLCNALAVDEPKYLYLWNDRRILAVCESISHTYPDGLPTSIDIKLDFLCPDPIWESTTETVQSLEQGTAGSTDQDFSWYIDYDGGAPAPPVLKFVWDHPENQINLFTYYGPNLLTNTRFDLGESTAEPGVPESWVASNYGQTQHGDDIVHYSHDQSLQQAEMILNPNTGDQAGGLYQDIIFTEAAQDISARVEFSVVKKSGATNTMWVRMIHYDANDAVLQTDTTTITQGGFPSAAWTTMEVEAKTTPATVAYVRFEMGGTAVGGGALSVLFRKPALVRHASASFPGHFDNKSFTVLPTVHLDWIWGEVFEINSREHKVGYYQGNDWEPGWPFFGGAQNFFELDPATPLLHFSWNIDHDIVRHIIYRERFWNA